MFAGCIPSKPAANYRPFESDQLDACLAIMVDMSGSFSDSWDDRAYPLFLELTDQFFTEGAGDESRIVIGQLSAAEKVVLFEGRHGDLRAKFDSPEALSQFLKENSDPSSSPVFQATERVVDYVSSMPGVTVDTRLMTVILSDMADNQPDLTQRREAGEQMLSSLTRYQEMGGGLALYYVALDQTTRWRKILAAAGFSSGSYVIENTLVNRPQLPRFD